MPGDPGLPMGRKLHRYVTLLLDDGCPNKKRYKLRQPGMLETLRRIRHHVNPLSSRFADTDPTAASSVIWLELRRKTNFRLPFCAQIEHQVFVLTHTEASANFDFRFR